MKIEKLTDNKIRIIIKSEDLIKKNIDINSLISTSMNSDSLILEMLDKAEKELDFNTDGCKLLIEAFSSTDDNILITITKSNHSNKKVKKTLSIKKKNVDCSKINTIFKFQDFDTYCNFCKSLSEIHNFKINMFSKNISLYLYNNIYYLIIKNIDINYDLLNKFYSYISEFSKNMSYSTSFENKLIERGYIIMKKNALQIGIKYFT